MTETYGEFHVDSDDDLDRTQANYAVLNIPKTITDVTGLKVLNCQIPFSYYVINATNSYIYFKYTSKASSGDTTVYSYPSQRAPDTSSHAGVYYFTAYSSLTNAYQYTGSTDTLVSTGQTLYWGTVNLSTAGWVFWAQIPWGTYTSSQMAIMLATLCNLPCLNANMALDHSVGWYYPSVAYTYVPSSVTNSINFLPSTGQLTITPSQAFIAGSPNITFTTTMQMFYDNVANTNLVYQCDVPLGFKAGSGSYTVGSDSNVTNNGFGNSAAGTIVVSPYPVSLSGPNYVFLRSSMGNTVYDSTVSSNSYTGGILAKIPIDKNYQEIIYYINQEPSYFSTSTEITSGATFYFTLGNDSTNTPINFNGHPFSITIAYKRGSDQITNYGYTQNAGFISRSGVPSIVS